MQFKILGDIDLFISHASEDKDDIVRPLANYLRRVGVKVWYDEFTLTAGDSLSRSIDHGLTIAKYGLVVISPNFIEKPWPEYELRGLTAKEVAGVNKVIIPVWHRVTLDNVLKFSPPLADKLAVVTANRTLDEIAEDVLRAIRPDLSDRMTLLRKFLRTPEGEPHEVEIDKITLSPRSDEYDADPNIVIRALMVVTALENASSKIVGDFPTFLADLYSDIHPEIELRTWEEIAAAYMVVTRNITLSIKQREQVVALLLACSLGSPLRADCSELAEAIVEATLNKWIQLDRMRKQETVRLSAQSAGPLAEST
jgi:hypothetical protein